MMMIDDMMEKNREEEKKSIKNLQFFNIILIYYISC